MAVAISLQEDCINHGPIVCKHLPTEHISKCADAPLARLRVEAVLSLYLFALFIL